MVQHEATPTSAERKGQRDLESRAVAPLGAFSDLFDPFFPANRSLTQLLDSMDRMFDDAFLPPMPRFPSLFRATSPLAARAAARPGVAVRTPWDVRETDDAFHIRLDMPGLSKEEVSVKLENGDLVIRGEHKAEEKGGEEGEGLRDARVAKSYQVTLALPDNVLTNQIKAEMKNGVLTVTMAKGLQIGAAFQVEVAEGVEESEGGGEVQERRQAAEAEGGEVGEGGKGGRHVAGWKAREMVRLVRDAGRDSGGAAGLGSAAGDAVEESDRAEDNWEEQSGEGRMSEARTKVREEVSTVVAMGAVEEAAGAGAAEAVGTAVREAEAVGTGARGDGAGRSDGKRWSRGQELNSSSVRLARFPKPSGNPRSCSQSAMLRRCRRVRRVREAGRNSSCLSPSSSRMRRAGAS
ncbi:unnamed protein product [Closterium sp. Naga37s-1]|nr:unnamed protein product [Closterium sp. Naga37s-1]